MPFRGILTEIFPQILRILVSKLKEIVTSALFLPLPPPNLISALSGVKIPEPIGTSPSGVFKTALTLIPSKITS